MEGKPKEYLLTFSENCSSKIKDYFVDCLVRAKFDTEREEFEGKTLVSVGASFELLAAEAEEISLEKATKDGKIRPFVLERLADFSGSEDKDSFFTPAERGHVLLSCLESVKHDKEKFKSLGVQLRDNSLITGCLHSKPVILESAFPLHVPHAKEMLWKKMKANPLMCPLEEIRDYYGEGVAFYFAWMMCFTWTLIPIAVLGLLMYFFKPPGVTVDDNPLLPLYEVFMAFWAISFMVVWKRKESEFSYHWNTYNLEHLEQLRPQFHGEIRPSPITGKPEKYFPRWKRWLRYGFSFVLTLPVLMVAVGAMLCSLNLNGYIKDKESPVYFASLAYFAEPVSLTLCSPTGVIKGDLLLPT